MQIDFSSCAVRKQKKTEEKKKASPLAVQGDAKCYNRPKSGWAGQIKAEHREEERAENKWKKDTEERTQTEDKKTIKRKTQKIKLKHAHKRERLSDLLGL